MTSLLRKFVAVRQRSKSPVKGLVNSQPNFNTADHEFEHWSRGIDPHLSAGLVSRPPPPPQRMPPQIKTQYVDEDLELHALTVSITIKNFNKATIIYFNKTHS